MFTFRNCRSRLSYLPKISLLIVAMLMISVAISACASEEEPAPAQPAPAAPTAAAPAQPAPAPTAAPAPAQPAPEAMEQSDTLTVVLKATGAPVFRNGKLPWPSSTFLFGYGIAERLGTVDDDYKPTQPMLSTGWEMADDQSEVIVNLRDDVEFHQGWGMMTADDVCTATTTQT